MNRYKLAGLSLAGGILSGLAWSGWFSGLILLVSFTPFLIIENHLFRSDKNNPNTFFIYLIPGFLIFNIITLGWVRVASIPAAITIITGLTFTMSFILWLAHIVRLRTGNFFGSAALIAFWLSFEFLSLHTVFLSPWVNLGNGLAKDILFIQWYEITGVAGGTLWILISNLLLGIYILNFHQPSKKKYLFLITWIALIIIPSLASFYRYSTVIRPGRNGYEVVIVQPDFDPYSEKFSVPFSEQLSKVLSMAESKVTDRTAWLVTPETTIDDPVNEKDPGESRYIPELVSFARKHKGIEVIAGIASYKIKDINPADETGARMAGFPDYFNSAFHINSNSVIGIYHKSKLVPGFEMQFSKGFGKMINSMIPEIGRNSWGYSTQDERTCFIHSGNGQVAGPVICYESVFGNFVADYVRKGAGALFIITNDGWWKNTNGYKQHLAYASLRAIETRRPVIRAANTGISCLIDIRGNRTRQTEWWTEDVIRGDFYPETMITPYVFYGDLIMSISAIIAIVLFLYTMVMLPLKKKFL